MIRILVLISVMLLCGAIRLAHALRLSVPLLYGVLAITVFHSWYLTHTALADGIFFVVLGLTALSWLYTLVRMVRGC